MDQLTLPKLSPMNIILQGLRPNDDWYEKKKLDELDDIFWGKVMVILPRKRKETGNGESTSRKTSNLGT